MTTKKELNYTALQAELSAILANLQAGELDVDEAAKLYERGTAVIALLESRLKSAETKITKLKALAQD